MHPRSLILLSLLLAACPDGDPVVPDGGAKDGPAAPPDSGGGSSTAFVAGSDFTSGALSAVSLTGGAVQKSAAVLEGQPVVRVYNGGLYVLEQGKGYVAVYRPQDLRAAPQLWPTGTADMKPPPAMSNPYDLYLDAPRQRAYVSLSGSGTAVDGDHALGIIDTNQGAAGIQRFVPLQVAAGDPDKNPDASRLFACGDTLYVLLQDLNRNNNFLPAGPARIAVVDLPSAQVRGYIALTGQNPTSITALDGLCEQVAVSMADNQFGQQLSKLGGVEIVDLKKQQSLGLALTEQDLGGHASTLHGLAAERVFVDVLSNDAMGKASHTVVLVDLKARKKGAAVLGPLGYVPQLRVWRGELLVLAAQPGPTLGAGLYRGPADGAPLTQAPLDLGLGPISMDILEIAGL